MSRTVEALQSLKKKEGKPFVKMVTWQDLFKQLRWRKPWQSRCGGLFSQGVVSGRADVLQPDYFILLIVSAASSSTHRI